jgi:hypothetical protein
MYMCIAPRNFTQAVARYNDVLVCFEIPFRLVCNLVYHTQIKKCILRDAVCGPHDVCVCCNRSAENCPARICKARNRSAENCLQHPKQAWTTPETTLKMRALRAKNNLKLVYAAK